MLNLPRDYCSGPLSSVQNLCTLSAVMIQEWSFSDAKPSRDQKRDLLVFMDRVDPRLFSQEITLDAYESSYFYSRASLQKIIKNPYESYLVSWNTGMAFTKKIVIAGETFYYQDPILIAKESLNAFKVREQSGQWMKRFDEGWKQDLMRLKDDAPTSVGLVREMEANIWKKRRSEPYIEVTLMGGRIVYYKYKEALAKTHYNLARVALAWSGEPRPLIDIPKPDERMECSHPWRDSFTGRRFLLDNPTSPTLIYSVGPDMKDEKGMIEFKPDDDLEDADTNINGDIVLRVGK